MRLWLILSTFLTAPYFLDYCEETHDIQVAFFTIYQEGTNLLLDISFDREDLSKVISLDDITLPQNLIEDYLQAELSFLFDNKSLAFQIDSINPDADHLRIKATFEDSPAHIQNIVINNTCLKNLDGHSNIINIRLQEQERDFLMNEDRTRINVEL